MSDEDKDVTPADAGVDVVGHRDWMAEPEFSTVFCPGDAAGVSEAIAYGVQWVRGRDGQRWFHYDSAREWHAANDPELAAFHAAQRAEDDAWRARRDES